MIIVDDSGKWRHTYSNQNVMIERDDGVLFCDAYDKKDSERTYTETDIEIKNSDEDGV